MAMPFDCGRPARVALSLVMALLMAGCMLLPGRFASNLDLRRDGTFTFDYAGEIHILALSRLAMLDAPSTTFTPSGCTDDAGKDRPCTAREVADQKAAWEESRHQSAEKRRRDAEKMKPLLGGIDYSDPKAAEELAGRLRKQAGWRRVVYRGDGKFDVDFALTGRMDHDFQFPTIERFPSFGGFLTVSLRNDGTVRVDAPGFGPAPGGDPWRSMMGMAAMSSGVGSDGKGGEDKGDAAMPVIDGTFTLTTDGVVVANNTDGAPADGPRGRSLVWPVNVRTGAAPMAIVRLAR